MDRILKHIKEEEIIQLACDIVSIPSPTGHERAVGEYIRSFSRNSVKTG
jgi:acetylornithine deacetylase/succinyl-diaminopimelate desuccinylase-like protein